MVGEGRCLATVANFPAGDAEPLIGDGASCESAPSIAIDVDPPVVAGDNTLGTALFTFTTGITVPGSLGVILEGLGYGGQGGAPGDSPGGGGGGGYSGGGGGAEADKDRGCLSGGGGGGSSYAMASTETCSIAPTSSTISPTSNSNPNGWEGFVRIGVDLGGC